MNRIKHLSRGAFQVMGMTFPFPMGASRRDSMSNDRKPLVNFADAAEGGQWCVVTDGVMGGHTVSRFGLTAMATALFEGDLSLRANGGFASVGRRLDASELDGYTGVVLHVKGDGRAYQFRVRTDDRFDGIAYQAMIATEPTQWQTVSIPFRAFQPTFRGRLVPYAPELRPERIRQIGFLLADLCEGRFRMEIEGIEGYRAERREKQADDPASA